MPLAQCLATVMLEDDQHRCEKAAGHPGLHLATPGDRRVSWMTPLGVPTPAESMLPLLRR